MNEKLEGDKKSVYTDPEAGVTVAAEPTTAPTAVDALLAAITYTATKATTCFAPSLAVEWAIAAEKLSNALASVAYAATAR